LRLFQLEKIVNLSYDQGLILNNIYKLWQTKKFTLVGLESSLRIPGGRAFFESSYIYYLLLPWLLLAKWNPLAGSYFFILVNLLALYFLFKGTYQYFGPLVGIITSILFIFFPRLVYHSQFIWGPNLLPFASAISLFLMTKLCQKQKNIYLLVLGLIGGLGFSWHYSYALSIIIIVLWLFINRFTLRKILIFCLGFAFGFSGMIIFELRHHFYNLNTILIMLGKGTQSSFSLTFYYFLNIIPFICLAIASLLRKVFQKRFLGLALLLTFFILISLSKILQPATQGYDMPIGWTYEGLQKTSTIILKENLTNYNIASLLYGDTRDYPLRYLLTIAQKAPLGVEIYPQAQYLFVTARQAEQEIINNSIWEIHSFCPCHLIKRWPIQNNISLYLLQKNYPVKIP
jgi:hypothetical protein